MRSITAQQKAFADYFIETGNQTEAYMKAYPKVKSRATAATCASKLLRNANVAAYIAERQKQIEDSRIADVAEVMQFFTRILRNEEKGTAAGAGVGRI